MYTMKSAHMGQSISIFSQRLMNLFLHKKNVTEKYQQNK